MRHRVKTKILSRDSAHRKSLLRNLSTSLVENEKIVTTVSKAKYLRPYFEKLITKAKSGEDFNNVKYMKARLNSNDAVKKILSDLGKRFSNTAGGYTRIIKVGNRAGDNAPMARIELTLNAPKKEESTTKKAKIAKKDAESKKESK